MIFSRLLGWDGDVVVAAAALGMLWDLNSGQAKEITFAELISLLSGFVTATLLLNWSVDGN